MHNWMRWSLGLTMAVFIAAVPITYYRAVYTNGKRLRVVTPHQFYRSGQLTVAGFTDAINRHGIRTVVNLQEDIPDPKVARGYFDRDTIDESKLCRELGVTFEKIAPDLINRNELPQHRPRAIDRFLEILDDPKTYPRPILVHCKAGLHRTGIIVAIYRMEAEGWTPAAAMREVRANGFGEWACTSANDYIWEYVMTYKPGIRVAHTEKTPRASGEESTASEKEAILPR